MLAPITKPIGLAALLALLSSCIGSMQRSEIESAGVKVGDTFSLASDAVIFECEPRDTASEFWFSSVQKKRCLKSRADTTRYDRLLSGISVGISARVSNITYINGVDTVFHLAYLQVAGVDGQLIAYEFHLPGLTGATHDGR